MTARSGDPDASPGTAPAAGAAGSEIWGTQEELLLAFAVQRHGTANWESVAMELKSRCSSAADAARLTPPGCRLRFRQLNRRFAAGAENGGGGDEEEEEEPTTAAADGLVEELRKLRVAELRREVARYDLSIGSLQSKVKRLTEERERSISGEAALAPKEEDGEAKGSPRDDDLAGEDRVSGGESGRSCKESNSSDLKRPVRAASASGDGDAAVRDGKEEVAAHESASVKREEASGESVAGSKEADAEKESSDVQSSASPSRRREQEREGGGTEVAEAEAASPSSPAPPSLPAAEAEALSAFLESVRTSKAGGLFARRLESQDDGKYMSTIRRHVDLETIRSSLEAGGAGYSSASEFYRDLLLLCTNAVVFFRRGSPEHAAAVQTRALVSKHMSASLGKDQPGTSGKASAASNKKPKADADVGSLLEKTAPIIVCRKRSSITKAAAAAAKAEKAAKEETDEEEENEAKKKAATKDTRTRGPRTTKSRGGLARKAASTNQRAGRDSESDSAPAEGTKKSDKKGGGGAATGGVAKKRNAVDFLNRMKQNSGPSTERVSLLETLKLSAAAEQKKPGKGDARKESGSGSKRGKDITPPSRRIGRPPKRAAAPPTPPPSKRARGSGRRGGKK